MFLVGQKVLVRPVAYPMEVWRGRIEKKAKYGFKVRYECHGCEFSEVFGEREILDA